MVPDLNFIWESYFTKFGYFEYTHDGLIGWLEFTRLPVEFAFRGHFKDSLAFLKLWLKVILALTSFT